MKTKVSRTSLKVFHTKSFQASRSQLLKMIAGYMIRQKRPKTRKEIGMALGLDTNQYSGRCNDLLRAKVLVQVGEVYDGKTKRQNGLLMHALNAKGYRRG